MDTFPNLSLRPDNMSADEEDVWVGVRDIAYFCHLANTRPGRSFWHDPKTGERLERNIPEMLMLIVTEVSEAMEAYRKDLMDDKLPHRRGIEVELADALIRIADTAQGLGLDLAGAVVEKMRYNATRQDHSHAARLAAGGKKC